jgi:hypothetical protein
MHKLETWLTGLLLVAAALLLPMAALGAGEPGVRPGSGERLRRRQRAPGHGLREHRAVILSVTRTEVCPESDGMRLG